MKWYEGLGNIFWFGERPKWKNAMWNEPSREWVENKFRELYPLGGEYELSTEELLSKLGVTKPDEPYGIEEKLRG